MYRTKARAAHLPHYAKLTVWREKNLKVCTNELALY